MGKTDNKITDTTAASTRSEDNTSTEATSSEGKRGRGRPRKDSITGREQTEPTTETDLPRLVLVDVPPVKEEDQPTDHPEPKAPAKRKRKDIQYELKKEQVSILIKTCFDIAGSRDEIWKLSQKEADLIAEPLAAILNKNPVIGTLTNKYGDVIALTVALATIMLPRIMVLWAAKPKKEKVVKPYVTAIKSNGEQKNATPGRNESGTDGNNYRQLTGKYADASEISSGKLFNVIPSIQ